MGWVFVIIIHFWALGFMLEGGCDVIRNFGFCVMLDLVVRCFVVFVRILEFRF